MDRSSPRCTRHPFELSTVLDLAAELPPMNLPEDTEPEHRGSTFDMAPRARVTMPPRPRPIPPNSEPTWVTRIIGALLVGAICAFIYITTSH